MDWVASDMQNGWEILLLPCILLKMRAVITQALKPHLSLSLVCVNLHEFDWQQTHEKQEEEDEKKIREMFHHSLSPPAISLSWRPSLTRMHQKGGEENVRMEWRESRVGCCVTFEDTKDLANSSLSPFDVDDDDHGCDCDASARKRERTRGKESRDQINRHTYSKS